LKGISLVTDLLEDALSLDGTLSLSIALRSAEVAQEKETRSIIIVFNNCQRRI